MSSSHPPRGTGPRLIDLTEAAAILRVSERDIVDWIERDMIAYVTLADGERRIRLNDETYDSTGPLSSSFIALSLHENIDASTGQLFERELESRRRQESLRGLKWPDVNVDAFGERLAARFAAVVPDPSWVSYRDGVVRVAGSGIDVALFLADDDSPLESRVVGTARAALDTAADAIADRTTGPWPATPGQFPGGFAPIHAAIEDGLLHLTYGEVDQPVLTLDPIPIDEIIDTPGAPAFTDL